MPWRQGTRPRAGGAPPRRWAPGYGYGTAPEDRAAARERLLADAHRRRRRRGLRVAGAAVLLIALVVLAALAYVR